MKINYKNGQWFYPDGTKFTSNKTPPDPVWCSKDGIIRLMNYENKKEANKQIKRLYEVFCND